MNKRVQVSMGGQSSGKVASIQAWNDQEQHLADMLENFGRGIVPKIIRAQLLYGIDLLDHLLHTGQDDLLMQAIEGTLDLPMTVRSSAKWRAYEVMRGAQFPANNSFLVTNGRIAIAATHRYNPKVGYQWWDRRGSMLTGVTHYTEGVVVNERSQ